MTYPQIKMAVAIVVGTWYAMLTLIDTLNIYAEQGLQQAIWGLMP